MMRHNPWLPFAVLTIVLPVSGWLSRSPTGSITMHSSTQIGLFFNGTGPTRDLFVSGNLSVGRESGNLDVKGSVRIMPRGPVAVAATSAAAYEMMLGQGNASNAMVIKRHGFGGELFRFSQSSTQATSLAIQAPNGQAAELILSQQGGSAFKFSHNSSNAAQMTLSHNNIPKMIIAPNVTTMNTQVDVSGMLRVSTISGLSPTAGLTIGSKVEVDGKISSKPTKDLELSSAKNQKVLIQGGPSVVIEPIDPDQAATLTLQSSSYDRKKVSLVTTKHGEFQVRDYMNLGRLDMDPLGMSFGRGLPSGSKVRISGGNAPPSLELSEGNTYRQSYMITATNGALKFMDGSRTAQLLFKGNATGSADAALQVSAGPNKQARLTLAVDASAVSNSTNFTIASDASGNQSRFVISDGKRDRVKIEDQFTSIPYVLGVDTLTVASPRVQHNSSQAQGNITLLPLGDSSVLVGGSGRVILDGLQNTIRGGEQADLQLVASGRNRSVNLKAAAGVVIEPSTHGQSALLELRPRTSNYSSFSIVVSNRTGTFALQQHHGIPLLELEQEGGLVIRSGTPVARTGLVSVDATHVTGYNTSFRTDIAVGDLIFLGRCAADSALPTNTSCNATKQSRLVVMVINDTSLFVHNGFSSSRSLFEFTIVKPIATFQNSTSHTQATVTANGYFGIGTRSPRAPLHVDGTVRLGKQANLHLDGSINTISSGDAADLTIQSGLTRAIRLRPSTKVRVEPNTPGSASALQFQNDLHSFFINCTINGELVFLDSHNRGLLKMTSDGVQFGMGDTSKAAMSVAAKPPMALPMTHTIAADGVDVYGYGETNFTATVSVGDSISTNTSSSARVVTHVFNQTHLRLAAAFDDYTITAPGVHFWKQSALLRLANKEDVTKVVVSAAGHFGVGTEAPRSEYDVRGDVRASRMLLSNPTDQHASHARLTVVSPAAVSGTGMLNDSFVKNHSHHVTGVDTIFSRELQPGDLLVIADTVWEYSTNNATHIACLGGNPGSFANFTHAQYWSRGNGGDGNISSCIGYCTGQDYHSVYAGIRYSTECWCGGSLAQLTSKANCTGDICGSADGCVYALSWPSNTSAVNTSEVGATNGTEVPLSLAPVSLLHTRQVLSVVSETEIMIDEALTTRKGTSGFTIFRPIQHMVNKHGKTQVVVDALGRVGIGTVAPKAPLDIAGGPIRVSQEQDYFEMYHNQSRDEFIIRDEANDLLRVAHHSGDASFRGDLYVGNSQYNGPRMLKISSTDSTATVKVTAEGKSRLHLQAPELSDARVQLTQGNHSFHIRHDASTAQLAIEDDVQALFSITKGSGATHIRGDLVVGGSGVVGPRTMNIKSQNSASSLLLKSGGSSDSMIRAESPSGRFSRLVLSEEGGNSFTLLNDGGKDQLSVGDGTYELLALAPKTGAMNVRGDLQVGGSSSGSRIATVQSTASSAALPQTALQSSAQVSLPKHLSQKVTLTVCFATKESGGYQASDFAPLNVTYHQHSESLSPSRTFRGSPVQSVTISGLVDYDAVVLLLNTSICPAYNSSTTASSTMSAWAHVPYQSSTTSIALNVVNMVAGKYMLCRQSRESFISSPVVGPSFILSPPPDFYPRVIAQGVVTDIFLSNVQPGDFVVVKQSGCSGASSSSSKAVLQSALNVSLSPNNLIGDYCICVASAESLGDEDDDYYTVPTLLHVASLHLATSRIAANSGPHVVSLSNGILNGSVAVMDLQCTGTTFAQSTLNSSNLQLSSATPIGSFDLCLKMQNTTEYMKVGGLELIVIATPMFHPLGAHISQGVTVSLSHPATEGDFVALMPHNCSGAASVNSTSHSLSKMALDEHLQFKIPSRQLTKSGSLKLCFATKESGARSDTDFTEASRSFEISQIKHASPPPVRRIVVGSGPHMINVTNVLPNDMITFRQIQCPSSAVEASSTQTKTEIVAQGQTSAFTLLGTSLSVGTYHLCRNSTALFDIILVVEPLPTFDILAAVAGSSTEISFSNAAHPGDFVTMQSSCDSDPLATQTGARTLARSKLSSHGTVLTSTVMTDATPLKICFATQESGGDESSDFVELPQTFEQLAVSFGSTRMVHGSGPYSVEFHGLQSGNQIVLQANNCSNLQGSISSSAFHTSDAVVAPSHTSVNVTVGSNLLPGSYRVCYASTTGNVLIPIQNSPRFTIEPQPTFYPRMGFSAAATAVTFYGAISVGDFVSFQTTNCSTAQHSNTQGNNKTLVRTPLGSNFAVNTTQHMVSSGPLVVCFATFESGGDEASDFVALANNFTQVTIGIASGSPDRIVQGAGNQPVRVTGLTPLDSVIFSSVPCGIIVFNDYEASAVRTHTQVLSFSQNSIDVVFDTKTLQAGSYSLCVKSYGQTTYEIVAGVYVSVIPKPIIVTTSGAMAGVSTTVTLGGSAHRGDYVFMTPWPNCTGVATMVTTNVSLAAVSLDSNLSFKTSSLMNAPAYLTICFATKQSIVDSLDDSDFCSLVTSAGKFEQTKPRVAADAPTRVVQGSGAHSFLVEECQPQELLSFTRLGCSSLGVGPVAASANNSASAVADSSGAATLVLHSGLAAGEYHLCHSLNVNSTFSRIYGASLNVVALPDLLTTSGSIGNVNTLKLHGSALAGDFVVLKALNCTNAHNATDDTIATPRVTLSNYLTAKTSEWMTSPGPFKVCFATKESNGDEASDFVELVNNFWLSTTDYFALVNPQRIVVGSGQHQIRVQGLDWNDTLILRNNNCSGSFTPGASSYQTANARWDPVINDMAIVTISPNLTVGQYAMCHQPVGHSIFHEIAGLGLHIILKPKFQPHGGKAGLATPIHFDKSIADQGDFVALTSANNCMGVFTSVGAVLKSTLDKELTTTTQTSMVNATMLHVCYATRETGGAGPSAWTMLSPSTFEQSTVSTESSLRLAIGSGPHTIALTGLSSGDSVAYHFHDCSSEPFTVVTHTTTDSAVITIHRNISLGTYVLCRTPSVGNVREVPGLDLTIVGVSFSPTYGGLQTASTVSFNGTLDGDWVSMVPLSSDCSLSTAILKSKVANNQIYTSSLVNTEQTFRVCFATKESNASISANFASIGTFWHHNVNYTLRRVVVGSGPHRIPISGLQTNQVVMFRKLGCNLTTLSNLQASPTQTESRMVVQGESVIIPVLPNLVPGEYKLCRGHNSTASPTISFVELSGLALSVLPLPTFTPLMGLGGSLRQVHFHGASSGDLVSMQSGPCTRGADPSDAEVFVHAEAGSASLHVASQGLSSDALISVTSPSQFDAKLALVQGLERIELYHNGLRNELTVHDGANSLMQVSRGDGHLQLRGNLELGGVGTSGPRAATIRSLDSSATLDIEAGPMSDASMVVAAQAGKSSSLQLKQGLSSVDLVHDGLSSKFGIRDNYGELFSVSLGSGDTAVRGNLLVGNTAGSRQLVVSSSTSRADVLVEAATEAVVQVKATAGFDSSVVLSRLDESFRLVHAVDGNFSLAAGDTALLNVNPSGGTALRGDLKVGSLAGRGPRTLTIQSHDSSAHMIVNSGASSVATININAQSGQQASLILAEQDSHSYKVASDGSTGKFVVSSNRTDLLTVDSESSVTTIGTDVTVGGKLSDDGPQSLSIESNPGTAWMPRSTLGAGGFLDVLQDVQPTFLLSQSLYKVCYATKESLGDEVTDFVELNMTFFRFAGFQTSNTTPAQPNYRTVGSHGRSITLVGLPQMSGLAIFFESITSGTDRCNSSGLHSTPMITPHNGTALISTTSLTSGSSYRVCIKPNLPIGGLMLSIIDPQKVTFQPSGGHAGIAMVVTFQGARTGDWIVMKASDCVGAANTTTTSKSLRTKVDKEGQVQTMTIMTEYVVFSVCFATKESGGVHDNDFVELSSNFVQSTMVWSL